MYRFTAQRMPLTCGAAARTSDARLCHVPHRALMSQVLTRVHVGVRCSSQDVFEGVEAGGGCPWPAACSHAPLHARGVRCSPCSAGGAVSHGALARVCRFQLLEKPQAKPAVSEGVVLPFGAKQQTTMLEPYGMLRHVTRHFFSDGAHMEMLRSARHAPGLYVSCACSVHRRRMRVHARGVSARAAEVCACDFHFFDRQATAFGVSTTPISASRTRETPAGNCSVYAHAEDGKVRRRRRSSGAERKAAAIPAPSRV